MGNKTKPGPQNAYPKLMFFSEALRKLEVYD